jgi:hypothetical protein
VNGCVVLYHYMIFVARNGQGHYSIARAWSRSGHFLSRARRLTNLSIKSTTTKTHEPPRASDYVFSKTDLSRLPPTHRPPNKQPHIRHNSSGHSAQRPTPLDPLRNRAPGIRSSCHGPFNTRLRLGFCRRRLIRGPDRW